MRERGDGEAERRDDGHRGVGLGAAGDGRCRGHQGSGCPVSHTFSFCGFRCPERWGSRGPGKESGREDQGKTGAPQLRLCREVRESGIEGPRQKGEGTQREWGQRPRESRRDRVMRWGMGLGTHPNCWAGPCHPQLLPQALKFPNDCSLSQGSQSGLDHLTVTQEVSCLHSPHCPPAPPLPGVWLPNHFPPLSTWTAAPPPPCRGTQRPLSTVFPSTGFAERPHCFRLKNLGSGPGRPEG